MEGERISWFSRFGRVTVKVLDGCVEKRRNNGEDDINEQ